MYTCVNILYSGNPVRKILAKICKTHVRTLGMKILA